MSKYIIHSCPERMWYVNNYLIPSIRDQSIDDVSAWCDWNHVGCLHSCMNNFMRMNEDGGTWHLQDDVIISRNFKSRTEELEGSKIVCGFVCGLDENLSHEGLVTPENMWWSFPCIYIPNRYAWECARWFYKKASDNNKYKTWIRTKKFDDSVFREFMVLNYPTAEVLNLKPCLVDHIDYLIGGSVVNNNRQERNVRAVWFDSLDLVDELEERLKSDAVSK